MSQNNFSFKNTWKQDIPASVVVFLVALPLCLGIALASGAPLFSGIIAGVVGGIITGYFSKSALSVSGPAAGLAVIVLGAINKLPSYEVFLLAVFLAGILQIILGVLRAGIIGDFIPSAVIKGMLAAIGIILILKQFPHAIGFDADYEGDESFFQPDGFNTFSEIVRALQAQISLGAVVISAVSLAFLFAWESNKWKKPALLQPVPGPLIVVVFGVLAQWFFAGFVPALAISADHMVAVPVADSMSGFLNQFTLPDFSYLFNKEVWVVAGTLSLVASIETLLSIEAVDKIDPYRRITPTRRELIAQGIGNITSGLIGGLPITSVIVRSSANVSSGAKTKYSAISHGILLLLSVIFIPGLLNQIPLAALAAILISVGYKLTKPEIFLRKYEKGWAHLIPFVATILAILFTDLLIGVLIGCVVGAFFVIRGNYKSAIVVVNDGNNYLLRFTKDLSFIHKYELKSILSELPENCNLMIDVSRIGFIDLDNAEILNDFIATTSYKGITVNYKNNDKKNIKETLKETANATL
ncbi:SulP family inorganic anion transporter [Sphingobacteriales bacterium UPWRP_1]|nr:hypothetical protein BVG80_07305 [Sphingobacteriales bacterium TSM_CSM]PSJ78236.1 SulP family inorganic anion transporter [Sphingobacteriales bacterium UPWRP_1]